ncbi:MAG: hypothetical protein ACKVOO_00410 [Burkholderiaceae bacterium]
MRLPLLCIQALMALCLGFCQIAHAAEVSEGERAQIRKLADAQHAAQGRSDIPGMLAPLAHDARVSVQNARASLEFGRSGYEAYLNKYESRVPDLTQYKFQRVNETFAYTPSGDGIVYTFFKKIQYVAKNKPVHLSQVHEWHLRKGPAGMEIYKMVLERAR